MKLNTHITKTSSRSVLKFVTLIFFISFASNLFIVDSTYANSPNSLLRYATPPRFLTYPFYQDSAHPIIMGDTWIRNNGTAHQGVDYFRADGKEFAILAAADGQAMYLPMPASCTWGNYIKIKHQVSGETWYTLYAHVSSSEIPADGAYHVVSRGSKIAMAGKTGYWSGGKNPDGSCVTSSPYSIIHLHLELSKNEIGSPNRVDPYGVYDKQNSGLYPGDSLAFTTDPPSYPGTITTPVCAPPSNGIPRDNYTINNNQVTFSWAPPSCDGLDYYTFRVANHSGIDNPPWVVNQVVDKSVSSVSINIPSEYNGQTLYWAIWPHNSAGYGPKGGPWSFKIDTSAPPPPPPLPTGNWSIQYFRNKELSDQCSTASFDRTFIFQDWGEGAPASGCNSDNWGARFTRRMNFQGGDYTFAIDADDWGRIYVDNNLFVDKWNGASQHYEGHYVTPGDHDVRVEFADTAGSAKISAWWWGPGFEIPHDSQDIYQWHANYWINPIQWWDAFASTNEGTGLLNHAWGYGSPGWDMPSDNFSSKFRRTVYFECGIYRFILDHDDGAKFYLDSELKVDRWSGSLGYFTIDLPVSRGYHNLQIDHYENGGAAYISFDWQQLSGCNPAAPSLQLPVNTIDLPWNADTTLDWSSSSGATQYFAQLQGGPGVDINSGWVTSTEWYLGGLWPGVYTWSVTARNDYGSSAPSSAWTFSIQNPPSIPPSTYQYYLPLILLSDDSNGQWNTILFEGFEGAFPGTWTIDDRAAGGSGIGYEWNDRSCLSSVGSWGGWAAGGGNNGLLLTCGQNYINNMDTWMIYGPLDLSNATAAELSFDMWLNSESNYDNIWWGIATDGANFNLLKESGNTNGWVDRSVNLANVSGANYIGQSQVWIAFRFTSDGSISRQYGAVLDEIMVRKCVGGICQ